MFPLCMSTRPKQVSTKCFMHVQYVKQPTACPKSKRKSFSTGSLRYMESLPLALAEGNLPAHGIFFFADNADHACA